MDFLALVIELGKLKRIPRTGWVRNFVQNPEDVADHSFRCALIAMLLGEKLEVDRNKLVELMLIHDIGEIHAGDLVVEDANSMDYSLKVKKEKIEMSALHELFGEISTEYENLYQEYIDQQTPLSKIAKQIDKLEMAIQALEYEEEQGKDLSGFFVNVERYIEHPEFKKVFKEILNKRKK